MSTTQMAFDLDLDDEWVPLMARYDFAAEGDMTKDERAAAWKAFSASVRCRDCGTKAKLNRGGSSGWVCDDCGMIDGCAHRAELMPTECEPGWHVSYWGERHTVDQHEQAERDRARRRASYRKRASK